MSNKKRKNLTNDIGFALTDFALIFSYAVCCSAAIGQGLGAVVLITCVCLFFSVLLKEKVLCPTPLLLVPLIFVFSNSNTLAGIFSLFAGGAAYTFLRKPLLKFTVPKLAVNLLKITLALCATILFTNIYFGIGASGNTPAEMLKSYISLGFHPHFTGLLTGTITLFMMITYPFKFKKLNKYLPAEFISLLIPFIINLILNPNGNLTTVNEASVFSPLSIGEFAKLFTFDGDLKALLIKSIIGAVLFFACFFILFSQKNEREAVLCGCTNGAVASCTCIPLSIKPVRGTTVYSACIGIVITVTVCILCPALLSRIPMHSVGAMLIVSAWQEAIRKEG